MPVTVTQAIPLQPRADVVTLWQTASMALIRYSYSRKTSQRLVGYSVLRSGRHGDRPARPLCLSLQSLFAQWSRRGAFLPPPRRCSQVNLCFPGITSASTQSAETRERAVGAQLTDDRGYAASAAWTGGAGGRRRRSPRAPHSNTAKHPRCTTGARQKAPQTPDDHSSQLLITSKYHDSKIQRFSVQYHAPPVS